MSRHDDTPDFDQRVWTMQIIAVALVMGVVLFAAVAVLGIGALDKPPKADATVSYIALAFATVMFGAHLVVPATVARNARTTAGNEAMHASRWVAIYQTKLVVALALLEGPAFFNMIALIIESHWWSLATAGALVFFMLAAFPTKTRVAQWVETQQASEPWSHR